MVLSKGGARETMVELDQIIDAKINNHNEIVINCVANKMKPFEIEVEIVKKKEAPNGGEPGNTTVSGFGDMRYLLENKKKPKRRNNKKEESLLNVELN